MNRLRNEAFAQTPASRCGALRGGERSRQRGVALIVALLIVAMVVLLATELSSDFLLMFRRTENQLYSEQAYAYMRGAEALSRAALLIDLRKDGNQLNDNLTEDWAQPQQYPTDYGWIGGQLEDLQGRFNLNSLAIPIAPKAPTQPPPLIPYSKEQCQLIRLLQALNLDEPITLEQAEALTDAITDWIDSDDIVSNSGGAESQYYESVSPPSRPANRSLVGPSELMMVKGMTPVIYRALAPLVTVWPTNAATSDTINLNTAPVEVLRSLGGPQALQPLSDDEVGVLLDARKPPNVIKDLNAVAMLLNTGPLQGKGIVAADLGVSSNYFLLDAMTEFQGHRYSMRSILRRIPLGNQKSVEVISRSFGDW